MTGLAVFVKVRRSTFYKCL